MSEPAPERPRPAPQSPPQGGGNILTKKVGPLPTWAWLGVIGVGGALVWYMYKSRQASAAAANNTATGTTTGNCTDTNGDSVPCDQVDYGGEIATLQTEIMDLQQGESGEGSTPPPTPTPTPNGTCAPGYTFVAASPQLNIPLPSGAYRVAGGYCKKNPAPPQPKPQQLTRTWTSTGGSTLAAVMGRLGTKKLTPVNAAAVKWYNGAYKKNHNAKMPKGLVFSYTEGTVTSK